MCTILILLSPRSKQATCFIIQIKQCQTKGHIYLYNCIHDSQGHEGLLIIATWNKLAGGNTRSPLSWYAYGWLRETRRPKSTRCKLLRSINVISCLITANHVFSRRGIRTDLSSPLQSSAPTHTHTHTHLVSTQQVHCTMRRTPSSLPSLPPYHLNISVLNILLWS